MTEGQWTLKYGSNDKHTLKVTAVSTVKLQYGFSTINATTIGEATDWPLKGDYSFRSILTHLKLLLDFHLIFLIVFFFYKGVKNSVLVAVTGGKDQVQLLTGVEIVNSDGSILFNLSLTLLKRSNDDFVFTTKPFTPPATLFFVVVSKI